MKSLFRLAITFSMMVFVIPSNAQKKKITLEDLFKKQTFRSQLIYGINPMNDGESYSAINEAHQVACFQYSTGKQKDIIFNPTDYNITALQSYSDYSFSQDEEKMLVATNNNPIYRYSFTADFFIYDIKNKTCEPLSEKGAQMNAAFSPNGTMIAFVRDNNIFIKDLINKSENQITTDGKLNHIINGAADWVYEEEFALTTGLQWSPDSKNLAYFRFDESEVREFNMTTYNGQLYPVNYVFKYPKAGEKNSTVSIHVYNIDNAITRTVDVGSEKDQYIARIKWTVDPKRLSILRLNRLQNKLDILIADAGTGTSEVLFTDQNKFYVDQVKDTYPIFTPDGKYFIITSEKDGYNHLYLYGMDGKLVNQLTKGQNEVLELYGFDPKGKRVFYQAYDDTPIRTAIFSVNIENLEKVKLSQNSGSNSANFSKSFKYNINFYSSASSPLLITLQNDKGKQLRVIEDNLALKERLANFDIPEKEFFSFKTSEGIDLNGFMIKPVDFNAEKKYPVLMYQYSGPGSISVFDSFSVEWEHYLAGNGYIIVCIDGRGTGGRGEAFKKITYGQMGYYESIDQIEGAKYLQTLAYVDPNRIGIWGWSYGGYMSSLCLFKGADVFKMAIAVAPVTNWRFYDTIYTERYMGLPQDNPLGYDNNSPINHVDKLKGKLLIVHGTGDDNVHFQNSIEMVEKLVQVGKQFDMQFYPDKNHGIYGGNTTMHLYTMLSEYVFNNL